MFEIKIIISNFDALIEKQKNTDMEVKKSPKASLENKRFLFKIGRAHV